MYYRVNYNVTLPYRYKTITRSCTRLRYSTNKLLMRRLVLQCGCDCDTIVSEFGLIGTGGLKGHRESTEGTFGRGDLSVCPLGGLTGALERLISNWRGVPPHWGPHRDKHEGHFLLGALLGFIEATSRAAPWPTPRSAPR